MRSKTGVEFRAVGVRNAAIFSAKAYRASKHGRAPAFSCRAYWHVLAYWDRPWRGIGPRVASQRFMKRIFIGLRAAYSSPANANPFCMRVNQRGHFDGLGMMHECLHELYVPLATGAEGWLWLMGGTLAGLARRARLDNDRSEDGAGTARLLQASRGRQKCGSEC